MLTDKYYQVRKPDGSKTMPEVFMQEYFSNAVDWVKKYANKSFTQLCKVLKQSSYSDALDIFNFMQECSGDNN